MASATGRAALSTEARRNRLPRLRDYGLNRLDRADGVRPPKPVSTWSQPAQKPSTPRESRADQLVKSVRRRKPTRAWRLAVAHPRRIGHLTAPTAAARHGGICRSRHERATPRPSARVSGSGPCSISGYNGRIWHYRFGVQGAGARSDRVGILVAAELAWQRGMSDSTNPPGPARGSTSAIATGAATGLDARLGAQRLADKSAAIG